MSLKNRSMSLTIGAAQGLLDALAKEGQIATYGYVAAHLGLHPHSTVLWEILGTIVDLDMSTNQPVRSSLVVNAKTLVPGSAYYERIKKHLPSGFLPDAKAEMAFWVSQLYRMGIQYAPNMFVLAPAA